MLLQACDRKAPSVLKNEFGKNSTQQDHCRSFTLLGITTVSTAACSCRRSVQVVTAAATVTGDEIV
jgi:hypothetical protein